MKKLKYLRLFEEIDVDAGTDRKMRENSKKMVDAAKKYEQSLTKEGIKVISKNSQSTEDSRKLREDAIKRIKDGDENAYGIMQWSDDICQSFQILSPVSGKEIVSAPRYAGEMRIYGNVAKDFVSLEVYNSPSESKALYMETDGEVLFQWSEKPQVSQGKLANQAKQLI